MGRSNRSACSDRLSSSRTGERPARGGNAPRVPTRLLTMTKHATSISCALVDGRPVFMDANYDSYFMLEPDEEAAFLAKVSGKLRDASLEAASVLGVDQPISIASCPQPRTSILVQRGADGRPSVYDVLLGWRLVASARRSIRRKPMVDLLAGIERGSAAGRASRASQRAAVRFAAARRFVPIPRNCLTDSIALLLWLARRGQGAALVFGVKLNPFAAHCWVQSDQLLLNDRVEHVERFTPVRAIKCPPDLQ